MGKLPYPAAPGESSFPAVHLVKGGSFEPSASQTGPWP